jgi:hypothetical protein
MRPAAGQRFHSDFPIEHAHVELVIEELTAEAEEVEDTRSAFERRDESASRLYQSPHSTSEATVLEDGVFNARVGRWKVARVIRTTTVSAAGELHVVTHSGPIATAEEADGKLHAYLSRGWIRTLESAGAIGVHRGGFWRALLRSLLRS